MQQVARINVELESVKETQWNGRVSLNRITHVGEKLQKVALFDGNTKIAVLLRFFMHLI